MGNPEEAEVIVQKNHSWRTKPFFITELNTQRETYLKPALYPTRRNEVQHGIEINRNVKYNRYEDDG